MDPMVFVPVFWLIVLIQLLQKKPAFSADLNTRFCLSFINPGTAFAVLRPAGGRDLLKAVIATQ